MSSFMIYPLFSIPFMNTLWLGRVRVPGAGQSHQGRGNIFSSLLIVIRHKDDLHFYIYHKSTYICTRICCVTLSSYPSLPLLRCYF
jgi:hypothetical protein